MSTEKLSSHHSNALEQSPPQLGPSTLNRHHHRLHSRSPLRTSEPAQPYRSVRSTEPWGVRSAACVDGRIWRRGLRALRWGAAWQGQRGSRADAGRHARCRAIRLARAALGRAKPGGVARGGWGRRGALGGRLHRRRWRCRGHCSGGLGYRHRVVGGGRGWWGRGRTSEGRKLVLHQRQLRLQRCDLLALLRNLVPATNTAAMQERARLSPSSAARRAVVGWNASAPEVLCQRPAAASY